jgi:orotate phosphoribosyltransferase
LTAPARAGSGGIRAVLDELREILVERSIRYGDFTLASGAKSRYYCDTKLTVLTPRGALLIGEALASLLRPYGVEAAGGLAMGAAYLATAVAIASEQQGGEPIHGFTVRAEKKDHGRGQKIDEAWHPDGKLLRPGRRVAVLDDVVTTAGSTLEALEAVQEAGCDVRVAAAVLDRRAGGAEAIRARGVPFFALFEADGEGRITIATGASGGS